MSQFNTTHLTHLA